MLDVKVKDWSIRDYQANKSMTFHLYNGEVSVQIRDTANRQQQQGSNKPIFYRPLSSYKLEFLKRTIEKIISASPETQLPVKMSVRERPPQGERGAKPVERLDWVFTVEKDAKMCIKFHITDVANNQTYNFLVRGSGLITVGTEPLSDADRSSAMIRDLLNWFNTAEFWAPATIVPFNPDKQRGGNYRRGGGGGHGGGGYSNNGGGNQGGNNGGGNGGGGDSYSDDLPF